MSESDSKIFNTLSLCFEPAIRLQFIFVEENDFPFLFAQTETNQASDGKVSNSTETEGTSQVAMGTASYSASLCDACDVICAPSVSCVITADNFIKELQKCLKDEMIDLKIKIDGGFSKTVEEYYLCKHFRSLVAERGYRVDETYESSVPFPENNKIDPHINLAWLINMAFLSLRNKYSISKWKMVVIFVDKSLERVLKDAYFMSLAPTEPHIPLVEKSLTIKIDGGFAETYVAFNLQSQFRLLAIENGYRVDEKYRSSAPFPVEYQNHPHLQLEKRLATTMESMKEKFSGDWDNIVIVFVHHSLKNDLKSIADKTPKPLEPPMGDAEAPPENKEENKT
ncbi:hypothetical protein T07_13233, partial [Trichinella nelsoni]